MTIHVLDQLPLWVEGDLSGPEMAMVDRHLTHCPTCREASDEMRASQAWLRGALAAPFSASDEGAWRRAVMAQVRAEAAAKPVYRLSIRSALVAACAASLLIATLVWRQEHVPTASLPLVAPSAVPAGSATQTAPAISEPMASQDPARVAPLETSLRRPKEPVSSPIEGPTRIEFQTADPNVRIIWLAQARPLPETCPLIQEEP